LRNPIVCSGLFLEQTQAYIYIRLIASGIDKIHNCPKCLKEKHFQNLSYQFHVTAAIMVQRSIGVKKRKQDVIAFVNTMAQFIHRGSYAHITL
jgi:hypothetical protein